ncbi:hypothetical protein DIS24_g9077 [Lasiodiplodia hormozganensis]|uniref:Transmembrane protein n=1 Tax=Lasiodiplodia hormozganensis TaxID=869390 RepID=A0AA39XY12_9PEZI|nr:hypothetical protein DIS24_g9077 [Lasiodiplodia hormozganensis]
MAGTLEMVARDQDRAPPNFTPAQIPFAGRMISMFMSLVTLCVLSVCIIRRVQRIHNWLSLPFAAWLIIIIYVDSFLFVFVTALFKDIGLNSNQTICEGAILLCLICYMSTKIFIYFFLVEKAYIVRGKHNPRMKDKLFLFNCFFMMLPYTVVVILNFVWRIAYINKTGTCIIGMEKRAMMPLITFDVVVNVYMTILFIVPLRQLYSYKNRQNSTLHTMAFRTFVGSCATLTSSVGNLTVLMVLKGEPGWICLLCCNADILFSVLVLHWVTSGDRTGQTTDHSYPSNALNNPANHANMPNPNTSNAGRASRSIFGGSANKSRIASSGPMVGTETLMARHYQEAAIAAAAGFGKDWPNTLKADIEASCEPVQRSSADMGAIAMNRIVVTHERRMVVSGEGGEGNRSASSMTLGQEQQRRDEERLREGSVNDDGYVSETTTTTTRDGAGVVGGARFVQRQGSTDQMVQREEEYEDVDLERGERRRSHRR